MTTARPRRRWLRWLVLAVLVACAGLAFSAWRFSRDRERVASLVVAQVRESFGLELTVGGDATIDWFPPGIRLENVELRHEGSTLLAASALGASVPWRTLWTREPHVTALSLEGADVDMDAIAGYAASRADDGPPAPLRWPRLDTILVVDEARIRRAGHEPIGLSFRVEPMAPDRPVVAEIHVAQGTRTTSLEISGAPRDGTGLVLDPVALTLFSGDSATVDFDGKLRFAAARDWRLAGKLRCPEVQQWLVDLVPALPVGKALELDVDARREPALALRASGALGDSRVDADLSVVELPEGGDARAWLALATSSALRGNAKVDRWQVGDVQLEGIELRAGDEAAK